jgi:hypothetical protein
MTRTDPHEMRMVAGQIRAIYEAEDGREYYIVDGERRYLPAADGDL